MGIKLKQAKVIIQNWGIEYISIGIIRFDKEKPET